VQRKAYILVVETDDLIRALLERWLGEAGYNVTGPSQEVPARGEGPCLIIANVSEPQQAAVMIRGLKARHKAPILVTSARLRSSLRASADVAGQLGVRYVLPKPFTRKELLAAVRECLAEPA
jgi:DNA-binding response OmpR family regulator